MKPCVIALGFFDGVHLGHAALLRQTRLRAEALGAEAAALTFDRAPGKRVPLLTTLEDRKDLLRRAGGMDRVLVPVFDEAFRTLDCETFVRDFLVRDQGAAGLVCGWDYRFGKNAGGDAALLEDLCRRYGLTLDVVPETRFEGITVSSSAIRQMLQAGDLDRANRFLGHPWQLTGPVVHGKRLGRRLGFPTANLALPAGLCLPPKGVYAVRAQAGAETYPGVCNLGTRPTVDGGPENAETWLFDYDGDLYGKTLRLEFAAFLRPERRFESLEALRAQILRDRSEAEAWFENTEH